jgi:hypothetical protein
LRSRSIQRSARIFSASNNETVPMQTVCIPLLPFNPLGCSGRIRYSFIRRARYALYHRLIFPNASAWSGRDVAAARHARRARPPVRNGTI